MSSSTSSKIPWYSSSTSSSMAATARAACSSMSTSARMMPADERRHPLAQLRHPDVVLERRVGRQLACLLGDRARMVAHPLQLVRHVVQRQQVAQVARHRGLGRDRGRDARRGLTLDVVDLAVVEDHLERRVRVMCDERRDGGLDLALDQHPHPQDVVLDLVELEVVLLPSRMDAPRAGPRARPQARACPPPRRPVGRARPHAGGSRFSVIVASRLSRTGRTRSPRSAGWSGW